MGGSIPFIPALYDIKAVFAGEQAHCFPVSVESLLKSIEFEVENLGLQTVTVAYDIYNIEAEAAGAIVTRNVALGMPQIETPLINSLESIDSLNKVTCPTGRMPLFLTAAKKAFGKWGNSCVIRGAVSGPFSMASKLFPREELLIEVLLNPHKIRELLFYCTDIIKMYAGEFVKHGAGVVIFDSFVAPPMLSPENYKDVVKPFHDDLISHIKQCGCSTVPLIIGGDTRPIINLLCDTGATQLLLDYTISAEDALDIMKTHPDKRFRYNLSPQLLLNGSTVEIEAELDKIFDLFGNAPDNWILGTAILPTNTNINKIKLVQQYIKQKERR